jgi:hypothetical protein
VKALIKITSDGLLNLTRVAAPVGYEIDRVDDDVRDAEKGFTLIFSATPFPNHQYRLDWERAEGGGNWYFSEQLGMEGWLCPALLRYFSEVPRQLYIQIISRQENSA